MLRLLLAAVALSLTLGVRPAAADVPRLSRISFTASSSGEGQVVRLHTTASVSGYTLPQQTAEGWSFRLFNTSLAPDFVQDPVPFPVRSLVVRPEGGHLLVEVALGERVPADLYRDRASTDLLLLLGDGSAPPSAAARPIARAGLEDVVATAPPSAAPPIAGTTPAVSSVEGAERWTLDTVVIDAGHGGKDHGASANGVREKDLTLAVARRLGTYLEERLGLNVVYTRDDDRFIELRDRGRIANEAGGKLFLSIHANAARSRSAYGTETFFLGMHKTDAARAVMERENEVIRFESDPEHYEDFSEEALILQTLAGSAYMRKSEQLAGLVEGQFAHRVGRKSRGVKQAGFYVLWSASMPAVLVELGFVTNPEEARFLRSPQGQDYMASAIFRAVRDFKAAYERDLGLTAD